MRFGLVIALLCVSLSWGPGSMSSENEHRILKVAHRGGAGLAPENTLAAFRGALQLRADAVELDVHMSQDGALVVIHAPDVVVTTDGAGEVADLTLATLNPERCGQLQGAGHSATAHPDPERGPDPGAGTR